MNVLLECVSATCGYHSKPILSGIDLAVSSGEAVALLGPNGSGKSTLLGTITRGIPLIAGTIQVSGDSISSLSQREIAQRVAVVPQEEAPRFAFTVREAVTLGCLARSRGLFDTPEDSKSATEAMRQTDCLHLEARPVTELSGGERQRVLLARALAQDAPLVLLDEPTAHLDPLHQVEVAHLTRELARQGRGVLVAIHDLNLAGEMADRALLLGANGVLLCGPVEEVLKSDALEEAYQVRFERMTASNGRIFVRPLNPLNLAKL
jgi:iron complex transport system ATP-binding protein